MQNRKLFTLTLFTLTLGLVLSRPARAASQFESFGVKQLGKLIANPPLFFYEFQRNMETTFPLPPGKRFGLNTHILGGILIIPLPDVTTAFNFSAKVRVHPEGKLAPGVPQIDLVGGYWNSLLTSLIEDSDAKASDDETKLSRADLNGNYGGIVFTSSLEPRVRLFWSYKLSKMNLDLGLSRPEVILGSSVSAFKSKLTEHTVAAGIEHTYAKDRRWVLEGGYGVVNNLLTAKVSWYRKYLELGFNIYPESVFIMQPQLNFHFNF